MSSSIRRLSKGLTPTHLLLLKIALSSSPIVVDLRLGGVELAKRTLDSKTGWGDSESMMIGKGMGVEDVFDLSGTCDRFDMSIFWKKLRCLFA